jgi:chromosomal replication initiator protein
LVSSQSFPHLWKKLWKIAQIDGESLPNPVLHAEMNLWEEILSRIETKVNRHSFYTWFRPTTFVTDDRTSVTVRVPNGLFKAWLTKHYSSVINEAMSEVKRPNLTVHFLSDTPDNPAVQLGPEEAAALETGAAATVPGPAGLNPRYTFDTFIVGTSNQFAHAACRAVAEAPSRSYNPLFIYGGVGLGKTHLMHAVGQYVLKHDRTLKLTYISAERFMNEMINAVRYDRIIDFRERYRTVDVLLVDDVQFIAGKEGTQTEFFHTFNALYDSQKQIVISSDCPPHEIPQLEERLRSRFEWGLIADIEPPDLETKIAIVKRKGDQMGVTIPDDVAMFIAGRVKSNIRELEGSLVRLIAIASLRGEPISKSLAQDAIRNIAKEEESGVITIQQIQKAVAQTYKLTNEELLSKNNARQISHPRQVAMYLCKNLTKHSYPEIGRAFGGKHHTTVMHSVEKIEAQVTTDETLQRLISELSESLQK